MTPRQLLTFVTSIAKASGRDGCWEWSGFVTNWGYGSVGETAAHRRAYELMVGPIADGLVLDHLCRNKRCLNPHHLEPVTRAQNTRRGKEYGPWPLMRFCVNGHQLCRSNVREWGANRRVCFVCHSADSARRRARRRSQHVA